MTFDKQKTLGDLKRRMQSVETLTWSIHFRTKWDGAPIAVHIDGKVSLYGDLNVITNPMWEVGLVHCRALLEFLGLCEKAGSLDQIEKRRKRDDCQRRRQNRPRGGAKPGQWRGSGAMARALAR